MNMHNKTQNINIIFHLEGRSILKVGLNTHRDNEYPNNNVDTKLCGFLHYVSWHIQTAYPEVCYGKT